MQRPFLQMLTYMSTVALGQLVSFALFPITTHYLPPAVYGEYALMMTLSNLVGVLGSSWIRNIAFRLYFEAKQTKETRSFYWTVAALQATVVTIAFLVTLSVMGLTHVRLGSPTVFLSAGAAVLASDFYALSTQLLRAEQQSTNFAVAEISVAGIRFAATSVGLLAGFRSPATLFLATAIAAIIPGVYAARTLQPRLAGSLRYGAEIVRDLVRLGPPALPFSLGIWVVALSDRLILEYFTDKHTVGIYSAGYTLADGLVGGIVAAVYMMAWPRILDAWNEGGSTAGARSITQALRVYFWLTVGPLVFIVAFHQELMAWVAGPSYAAGGTILPIVALGSWAYGVAGYLNRPLELQKRYGIMSLVTLVIAALNVGLNVVLVPRAGVTGAAVSTLIAYLAAPLLFSLVTDLSLISFPGGALVGSLFFSALAWITSHVLIRQTLPRAVIFVLIYVFGLALFAPKRAKGRRSATGIRQPGPYG